LERGGGLATCGVSAIGGRGFGLAAPGAGRTSIGGGSGATCGWPATGAGGALTTGGVGGRGIIPSRDNDTFGIGYYYNRIQTLRLSNFLGQKDSAQGFECFYNIAITPASHVTLDLQVVETAQSRVDTATVLGLRASLNF